MTKWEYYVELLGVDSGVAYFKREVPEEVDPTSKAIERRINENSEKN